MPQWMICFVALMAALGVGWGVAFSQEVPRIPLLYVTGEAQLKVPPDLVIATLGVATEAKSVAEAREQNAVHMQAVIEAVKKLGVAPRDISTTRFTVTPQYEFGEKRNPRIVGYNVSNQITVKLEAIETISELLDAALAAGANTVGNLNFTVKDPRALRSATYDEAVRDARSKAEALAKAAGIRLGDIHLLRESSGSVMPMRREIPMLTASKAETPIESGEVTVQVTVEMQFEITQ